MIKVFLWDWGTEAHPNSVVCTSVTHCLTRNVDETLIINFDMCHISRCHYSAQPLVDWRRNVWNNCVWISAISFELRKIKKNFPPDFTLVWCVYNRCCIQYSSSFWWCKRREMSWVVVFCWCFRFVQSQCDVLPCLLYVLLCAGWLSVKSLADVWCICAQPAASQVSCHTELNERGWMEWRTTEIHVKSNLYRMWVRNDVF